MSCTTLLVGAKASNDHSTMIARTDDGHFDVKKTIVVEPKDKPWKYTSRISHAEVELPGDGLRCTMSPSVDPKNGTWAATGINAANVGMTATETITSNPRVLAADPMVEYKKSTKRGVKDTIGGIGEEDLVVLTLPFIHSAREGVLRLGSLLEKYGTYESNGIAFNDEHEVWWLETIGGHHWMAKRVPDEVCVVMPNQFGMDSFDLADAFGKKKNNLCSKDLKKFIADNNLDCNQNGEFNPRNVFGSHSDMDHVYNTPRAWYMGRCLAPFSIKWEGVNAQYTPEMDNLPWAIVPDRKITVEDVKHILSTHYQGTDYDPYTNRNTGKRGMYRSIGINRTGVTSICQIRTGVPEEIKGIEWIIYGPTSFACCVPMYANATKIPAYLSKVTLDVSTDNLYWNSRLIALMVDGNYSATVQIFTRYENKVFIRGRELVKEYDARMKESGDYTLTDEANEKIAAMVKEETTKVVNELVLEASKAMKDGYNLADN